MRDLGFLVVFVVPLLILAQPAVAADVTLVEPGSFWKYNDTGTDLGTAWRAPGYNDGAWPSGAAQLGYGDNDEATVLSFGSSSSNKRPTYYFRQSFLVSDPSSVTALTVRFVRDDGCVIYLNGAEVARSNMPSGTVGYSTFASSAISGSGESAWQQAPVDPALLLAGTNVIAVEMHQTSGTSSDISFDLELLSTTEEGQPPTVTLTSPPNQAVVNTTSVTLSGTASSPAGLASATLYIGGPPGTVTFSGAAQIQDTQISADQPTENLGNAQSVNVDGQNPHAHGLIKIPTLIGPGNGQVPAESIITSATLGLNCTNPGNAMQVYRLTEDWVEGQASWNQRSSGNAWNSPGADGSGSHAGVSLNGDCTSAGRRQIDITPFVQQWSDGAPNYGVVLVDSGTDGIDFDSSESSNPPDLTVVFNGDQQAVQTTLLAGASASVDFPVTLNVGQTYFWNILAADTDGLESWAVTDFELIVNAAAPDQPLLISPADGSGGVPLSPTLSVAVDNPGGGMLDVTFSQRAPAEDEFTIIALPDTQHYSESFPAVFTSQTEWIAANKTARNIVFVTHLGDIVEHNNLASEWDRADTSMSILDDVVPYGMGPGNHDQPTTLYNQYFPYTRYIAETWYGGHHEDKNDNNFQLFSGGGVNFVIVHLEFCPPASAIAWADAVLKTYPTRTGIITTHGYITASGSRSVGSCSNTQYLWDGLAVPNPNVHFMLCGHVHDEGRRTDTLYGHPVYQMLSDYQDRSSGGEGWLRILRFVPAEGKVYVQTYSPWLNQYETDANSEFTLDFPMGGGFSEISAVTVASGSTASIEWPGLTPSSEHEWQVEVTNSSGISVSGPIWTFTTGSGGPPNQPPVGDDQAVSADEDTAQGILLSAFDPDGGPLSYFVDSQPAHGVLSGSAPNLTYQPEADYNGPDSFTFLANDGQDDSNIATVSIQVQAVNDPPVASGDSYTLQADTTLNVAAPGVLGNDTDIDSASLTAALAAGPNNGSLTLNADGSFSYTPVGGYSGPDSFTYNAGDGQHPSNTATVSLTVELAVPPNQPPGANAQSVSVSEDTALGIVLTGSDGDGDPLFFSVLGGPSNGTLSGSAPNLTYQPAANYNGPDSFTFVVNDGEEDSNIATVSIDVQAVNDPPVASGESYTLQAGATLDVGAPGVLSNDTDIDSANLTAAVATGPGNGSLSLSASGSFSYTPTVGYSGPDSFTYVASDGGEISNTATVSLTITPVGPPPSGLVFAAGFNADEDGFSYSDDTFRGTNQPNYASGAHISSGGFSGGALSVAVGGINSDSINNMSGGWARMFTLSAPTAVALSFRLNLTLAANYEDDEYSEALVSIDGVLHGAPSVDYIAQLTGDGNGGADSTTGWQLFEIPIGTLQAGTHTLVLGGFNNKKTSSNESTTVLFDDVSLFAGEAPQNEPPVADDQVVAADEDTAQGILLTASDPNGDPLSYSVLAGPSNGTLSGSAPNLTYQPAANYNGPDSFTFVVNDGLEDSNIVTVSIQVQAVNDPPVASGESYTLQAGATLDVGAPGVLSNDTDIDSANLTAAVVTGPGNGSLSLSASGSFSYTPTVGYSGPDSFTYVASDGGEISNTATVSLTITPVGPPPSGLVFAAGFNADEDGFSYSDDTFRGTNQPNYASGAHLSSGGFSGGALSVALGGVNSNSITNLSGGWTRTFTLSAPTAVVLSFRYHLILAANYDDDEYSQALANVDGVLYGAPPADYVAQLTGDGNGGPDSTTGWQLFEIPIGTLQAGTHTLVLGGFNNKKTSSNESTTVLFDDVSLIAGEAPPPPPPPPSGLVFAADFNSNPDDFSYSDDTFRGTNQPAYAGGSHVPAGGFSGGALSVAIGGVNSNSINNMSGGWVRTFTLGAPTDVSLSFRYNLTLSANYDDDEFSQVLASVDGVLYGAAPNGSVAQLTGDGNGGPDTATNWQLFEIPIGTLGAGTHALVLGGFNNKKTSSNETTTILIDDVSVTAP